MNTLTFPSPQTVQHSLACPGMHRASLSGLATYSSCSQVLRFSKASINKNGTARQSILRASCLLLIYCCRSGSNTILDTTSQRHLTHSRTYMSTHEGFRKCLRVSCALHSYRAIMTTSALERQFDVTVMLDDPTVPNSLIPTRANIVRTSSCTSASFPVLNAPTQFQQIDNLTRGMRPDDQIVFVCASKL